MRNYFRKCFLILVFLSLSQQPAQAIEIKLPWILGSLCAIVKNYLPTFSLFSFFAKYNFRRRNIEEQNNIIKQQEATQINNDIYTKIIDQDKKLLEAIEAAQKNNFDYDNYTLYYCKHTSTHFDIFIPYINPFEEIKICIEQGSNPFYLQSFFEKHPEYAKKYKQYELNIALLHAVKIAKKNHFEREENLEKIKTCINKGANPDCPIGSKKQTLLMLVATANKDLFDFLLTKGVNINARYINQNTVLHKLAFLYREIYATDEDSGTSDLPTSEIYTLENLLKHGADLNATNSDLETPLLTAIDSGDSTSKIAGCYPYFIKSLITSTNVNQPDRNGATSLWHAIHNAKRSAEIFCIDDLNNFNDFKVLEGLYKAGSSLINLDKNNNSIFHLLVGIQNKKHLEQHIQAILTHTQDLYKKQDQESIEKILESHFAFNKLYFPLDVQCLIFSFFSGNDTDNIKLLLKNKSKKLFEVNNQMIRIQNVLCHQNKNNKTPLQLLNNKYDNFEFPGYTNSVKNLFDENRPTNDFKEFLKVFPNIDKVPEKNWAGITYRYLLKIRKNK